MGMEDFFGDWMEVIPVQELSTALNLLDKSYIKNSMFPSQDKVLSCFQRCSYKYLRVVMLGDKPYTDRNLAMGTAFGIPEGNLMDKWPTSLRVLHNAVEKYCTYDLPFSTIDTLFPTFNSWEEQGILMLNTSLTTVKDYPLDHMNVWTKFVQKFIQNLYEKKNYVIFVAFGTRNQRLFTNWLPEYNKIEVDLPDKYVGDMEFPDIFKEIDKRFLSKNIPLIYWI